jgi:hypothetical protein
MYTTIIARHPGTCKRCGHNFEAGTRIRFGGRGRTYHLKAECNASADVTAAPVADGDENPARYSASTVADVYTIGGREYYRNKRGRCEDAPCCGCCTI